MKLIGVSPRILTEEGVQKEFVNTRYVKQLTSRGFNVIMLTLDNPNPKEILRLCDGFLITGGQDVNPEYFHEENLGLSKNCNESLDAIDKEMVDYAKEHKIPTLGICRGMQVINVFLGGSLFQDIGNAHTGIKGDHIIHSIPNRMFDFDPVFKANSYHHQAVKAPAEGVDIIAHHEDGTVEAIIHKELPIIGVQWHPEMIPDTKESKMIFDMFAKYVNENKK